MKPVTRRQFMKQSSLVIGTAASTAMISGSMFPGATAFAQNPESAFVETSCDNQGKRILVAYESLCGTTSRVAAHIGDILCAANFKVDVKRISNVTDISAYHGAVIGSAVKSASWHPGAIDFVKKNKTHLSRIPVAYFLTCLALYYDTAPAERIADSYFEPVLKSVPDVQPQARQAFAGVLDYDKLNIVARMVMKSKMKKKGIPEGDFRNFNKIGTWAQEHVTEIMTG